MIRAWFSNLFNESFKRDFETLEEFECFIDDATLVETKLIGYVSYDDFRKEVIL